MANLRCHATAATMTMMYIHRSLGYNRIIISYLYEAWTQDYYRAPEGRLVLLIGVQWSLQISSHKAQ